MTRIESSVQFKYDELQSAEVALSSSNIDDLHISNVDSLAVPFQLFTKQDQPWSDLLCEPHELDSFHGKNLTKILASKCWEVRLPLPLN